MMFGSKVLALPDRSTRREEAALYASLRRSRIVLGALVLGLGLPLLVSGVVLAVVLSPLWLLVLLVWWLWRRDRRAAPPNAQ